MNICRVNSATGVLRRPREHDQIMWDRACVDAASEPVHTSGEHTGRNPTDHGKLGCEQYLLVDQRGSPLAAKISGVQVADLRFLNPLVDAIPTVEGLCGRARKRQVSCTPIGHTLREHIGFAALTRYRSTFRAIWCGVPGKARSMASGR